MARHQLRRAGRCRQGDRPRPGRPRPREGRPRRDSQPHPPRVDVRQLRDPRVRRRLGLDLPDELPGRGPLRGGPLRVEGDLRRGRRAAREDPQDPRRPAAPRARHRVRVGRPGRPHLARRAARAWARPLGRRVRGARRRRHARRRLPLHLHVGHDRPAEGLHPHPRQLPARDRHDADDGRARLRRARLPLPAAGPRLRGADPVRRDRRRVDDRLLGEGPAEDRAQPDGGEAHLLPVGPADLREDLPAGHQQRARQGAARAGGAARSEGPARPAAGRGRARPS